MNTYCSNTTFSFRYEKIMLQFHTQYGKYSNKFMKQQLSRIVISFT